MIVARKINKMTEFYMIFARKMSEFYIILARIICFPIVSYAYGRSRAFPLEMIPAKDAVIVGWVYLTR